MQEIDYYDLSEYAMEETIGEARLFAGRKKILENYVHWGMNISKKLSRSSALIGLRKYGKTAVLQRLYNIFYVMNSSVIPFYFEIKEGKKWVLDFSKEFISSFCSQYLGFKLRKIEYIREILPLHISWKLCQEHGFQEMANIIDYFLAEYDKEKIDLTWDRAQRAPHRLASLTGEYILQIIDEFQYLNTKIYRDKACTNLMDDLASSYLTVAESKVAPVLCAGSYVSWLSKILSHQLPGRFGRIKLKELEPEEAIECVYRYSNYYDVEVTPETAAYISELCERHPFYIGTLVRSIYPDKDLRTIEGVDKVFEYELSEDGEIRVICNEYIETTFSKVNEKNAKKMVLFLAKNNEREYTVMEIKQSLGLDMDQEEIAKKLRTLSETDLVLRGSSSIDFQGIRDNIIARIIRMYYERELEGISKEELKRRLAQENQKKQEQAERILKKKEMISRYHRGRFAEYCILYYLEREGEKQQDNLRTRVYGLKKDVVIQGYKTILRFQFSLEGRSHEIDLYAKSKIPGKPILVWESKNYKDRKVTEAEVKEFETKLNLLKEYESPHEVIGIFYSSSGFSPSALEYMKAQGMVYTDYNTLWKGFI